MGRHLAAIPVLCCVLALATACGGDDGGQGDATQTGTATAVPTTTTPPPPTQSYGAEGVPDACTLITPAELSTLMGSEHGTGRPQRVSPDRSTCMYPNGTITAVEIAENYEATRGLIEGQGRKTQDVPGVGKAAFYDEAGQLVATGERMFVAVTAFGVDLEKLKQVALALLKAAGEPG